MAYTIQYSPENNKKYPTMAIRKRWNWLVATFLLAIAFALGWIGMKERTALKEFLLPGDPEKTESAVTTMVSDIREGTNVGEAITDFCLEILKNAE